MITASKSTFFLENIKILRPKVITILRSLLMKFSESCPWCKNFHDMKVSSYRCNRYGYTDNRCLLEMCSYFILNYVKRFVSPSYLKFVNEVCKITGVPDTLTPSCPAINLAASNFSVREKK